MSAFIQDVRFGLRLLWRDRSFTITALLTLAICIGANAAMFSVIRSVLLKPLPIPGSERLVLVFNSYPNAGAPRIGVAVPDLYDRIEHVPALEDQALFRREGMTYGDEQGAERLITVRGTPSFYRLVGVRPAAGRIFSEAEGEPGQNRKVILSYGFWQRKFGGRDAVGQVIRLNGLPHDVVGVMPADFTFIQNDIDLFTPAAFGPADRADNRRHSNNWQQAGRLAPGATIDLVRQQLDALNRRNDDRFPQFRQILKDANFHTIPVMLQDDVVRDVKAVLYLLWGGVAFVLLIGCVNLANLVTVRASARAREMATRHAIGGDLGRLARQLLTETTVLALAGGVAGLGLGWWATRSVAALNLDQLPRGYEIALDWTGVVAMIGLMFVVGVALGVAPALRLRRMNLNVELREDGRGGTGGRRAHRLRRVLATVQVAFALVLLIGAGLLLASFRAVVQLDFGFDPAQVTTANVSLPSATYSSNPAVIQFQERALDAIRRIPGVEAAGGTTGIPFSGNVNSSVIMAEGYTMKPGESLIAPTNLIATAGYFDAMRIPVARGRVFDARDAAEATAVAIVDERLARKFWPDQDPVGRRLYRPSDVNDLTKITPQTRFITVVGVVRDVQLADPRPDFTPVGTFYVPNTQQASANLTLAVRTTSPSIAADLRREIAKLDPQLPLFRVQPMQQWIDDALVGRRVPMLLALSFGVVALFLAAVGIYGVLAYSVAERRRELGVRLALGGTTGSVFRLVLRDGVIIIGLGVVAGIAGALAVGQSMRSVLFNVTPFEPGVLGAVTGALVLIAFVASAIPALRASRTNPTVVLGK
jgi:predicted permease